MRYLGGKGQLLNFLYNAIAEHTEGVNSVTDIFAGTGAVSAHFLSHGLRVQSNDILFFCYALIRGSYGIGTRPTFSNLGIEDPIAWLNALNADAAGIDEDRLFIYRNYSPGGSERMYFQEENALRIDIIRTTIEQWKEAGAIDEDEYFYLLAALLNAVPYVANITGTFAAYLKHWDSRTYKRLTLEHPHLQGGGNVCLCHNCDYTELLGRQNSLLYADPPYNERDYSSYYHLMETIARYDSPEIKGVTGMRQGGTGRSPFCSSRTVLSAFETLISRSASRYIAISYNNEGLLPSATLADLCRAYAVPGTFHLVEQDYRRYKNKIPNNKKGLKEQVFIFEKRPDAL